MPDFEIRPLAPDPTTHSTLCEMLVETVAHGGSVGFMYPLAPSDAAAFWEGALSAAARGARIVLGAWAEERIVGTVSLILDLPPNQPHRAEVAKMMTRVAWRGRGVARALLETAETLAIARGRTLLVLDTASEEGASGLYERCGYSLAGEIPDFALKPLGGLTGTNLYWKRIGSAAR